MPSSPINILHIIPSLSSGGAERQLTEVVAGTSREHFTHTVITINNSDFFAPAIQKTGNKVIDLKLTGKRPWFSAAGKINEIIKKNGKPDIINSWLYDGNIVARLVNLRNRNIPLITSLQAPDYDPEAIRAGNWPPRKIAILKSIDKAMAALTRPYFVACSDFVAASYREQLRVAPERMSVIHNSVIPEALACLPDEPEEIRRELKLPGNAFIFTNVGRLDPQKDQVTLLKAFQRVRQDAPNAYLLIIGAGGLEESLKGLTEDLHLSENVLFLGRRKDVGACLELSDVFVFPSLFEGLPLALLEAMAKGLPCIISDIGPHIEAAENEKSGLFVPTSDPAALANAMLRLYGDTDLRHRLGEGARQRTETLFYGDVLMPKWNDLYSKVFSSSRK